MRIATAGRRTSHFRRRAETRETGLGLGVAVVRDPTMHGLGGHRGQAAYTVQKLRDL
jgi:hypothetical protein